MSTDTSGKDISWRVGLTVLVGAACLGVILFLTGNYHLMEDGYTLFVTFDYARGIEVGAPVLVSGVKLGTVEDVSFVFQKNRSWVRLKMWLQSKAVVKKDSKIYVKTLGLLGEPVIEITTGTPDAEAVSPGETMDGEQPFVVEEVLAASREVVDGLGKAVTLFNSILEDAGAKQNIRATIQNLGAASAEFERTIRQNSRRIDTIAQSIERTTTTLEGLTGRTAGDIEGTIADLRVSSAQLRLLLETGRPGVSDIMDTVARAATMLERAMRDVRSMTEKTAAGKTAAGVLLADDNAARSMKTILKNLEDLSTDVKTHPWKLIRKP